jgi:hypothetical protein
MAATPHTSPPRRRGKSGVACTARNRSGWSEGGRSTGSDHPLTTDRALRVRACRGARPRQGKGAPGHAQLYINETSGPASNADGSIDVWFGTKPPARREKNWIQTVRGKGWFVLFRFYGPLEPFFDKTWKPGDIEKAR